MSENTLEVRKAPFSQSQLNLITATVAKGATPDELKLFLYTAGKTGLDPLTRQIHFVKRGGQMTIQTGIDGYRTIAERSGTLAGIDDAVFDSEDTAHPGKATVTVYRIVNNQKVSFTASARWSEYAPQGSQAFMWNKMPYLMLGKCAEALALRKAFPNDLAGVYTNEEMAQAETKQEIVPQPTKTEAVRSFEAGLGEEPPMPSQEDPLADIATTSAPICEYQDCSTEVNQAVEIYSRKKFNGKVYCYPHQRTVSGLNQTK